MSIVIIVSPQRNLKYQKKKKKTLSILVPSSRYQTQSPTSERMPRQMGYVGAQAKARIIYLRWYTCLHG